jgi:hydroxymethylpyrimidine kinase/phosphomethylpyrimidine kinase
MLGSAATISVVTEALQRHNISISVIDPVMVATTGARLLPEQAVKTLCQDLLSSTYLLTPNIPEANLILKEAGCEAVEVRDLDGLKELASAVRKLGPKHVLIKGGHIPLNSSYKVAASDEEKSIVVNILAGDDVFEVIESPYQKSRNTHGTGCSLACTFATDRDGSSPRLTIRSCNRLQPCQRPRHLIGSANSMSLC